MHKVKLEQKCGSSGKLPIQTILIQLLDRDSEHLAFIACRHNFDVPYCDFENDREHSHYLEEISNFENEILLNYFQADTSLIEEFGGCTGEVVVTGRRSEILYHSKPAY